MHRKGRSVPAFAGHDPPDTDDVPFARGSIARQIAVVTFPIRVGHQLTDVLADRLLLGIAKQSLGRGAEKLHDAISINDDHGIRHRVEDRAEVIFPRPQRLFEQFLLVDIENDSAEMAGGPGLILDEAASHANPLTKSRRPANPERNVEIAADLGGPLDRLLGAVTILWFEKRKKQLVGNRRVAADAEKASRGIGPLQLSR
jgi:hypothetical protein